MVPLGEYDELTERGTRGYFVCNRLGYTLRHT